MYIDDMDRVTTWIVLSMLGVVGWSPIPLGHFVFVLGLSEPCVPLLVGCDLSELELPAKLPMNYFASFFRCCVGEASNPGPVSDKTGKALRLAVTNPATVHKKQDEISSFGADLVVLSETSATSIVQDEMTVSFFKNGYKSYWSKSAPPKKQTTDSLSGSLSGS